MTEQELYKLLCPSSDSLTWRPIFAQKDNIKYCLCRGVFGNPTSFLLSWGSANEDLLYLIGRDNWFVGWTLERLIRLAKEQHQIDVLEIFSENEARCE